MSQISSRINSPSNRLKQHENLLWEKFVSNDSGFTTNVDTDDLKKNRNVATSPIVSDGHNLDMPQQVEDPVPSILVRPLTDDRIKEDLNVIFQNQKLQRRNLEDKIEEKKLIKASRVEKMGNIRHRQFDKIATVQQMLVSAISQLRTILQDNFKFRSKQFRLKFEQLYPKQGIKSGAFIENFQNHFLFKIEKMLNGIETSQLPSKLSEVSQIYSVLHKIYEAVSYFIKYRVVLMQYDPNLNELEELLGLISESSKAISKNQEMIQVYRHHILDNLLLNELEPLYRFIQDYRYARDVEINRYTAKKIPDTCKRLSMYTTIPSETSKRPVYKWPAPVKIATKPLSSSVPKIMKKSITKRPKNPSKRSPPHEIKTEIKIEEPQRKNSPKTPKITTNRPQSNVLYTCIRAEEDETENLKPVSSTKKLVPTEDIPERDLFYTKCIAKVLKLAMEKKKSQLYDSLEARKRVSEKMIATTFDDINKSRGLKIDPLIAEFLGLELNN